LLFGAPLFSLEALELFAHLLPRRPGLLSAVLCLLLLLVVKLKLGLNAGVADQEAVASAAHHPEAPALLSQSWAG
jgi:hypothetical protein